MKLISFKVKEKHSYGVVTEQGVIDLSKHLPYTDLKDFITKGSLEEVESLSVQVDHRLDDVQLLPVITNPEKIFCAGVNYDAHRLEVKRDRTEHPTIFFRVAESQIAHGDSMLVPLESSRLDYEGEIAIVIAKEGRRISVEEAYEYIAGYACYNDGTVRDFQVHTSQWGPGKNFSGTGAFGPYLVTRGEIEDGEVLNIETRLNGEVMQKSDTNYLLFSIPELIQYVSQFTTLKPGDVIVTGTPGGVGNKRNPQVFMKDGDIVEVEVTKLGVLTNPIKQEQKVVVSLNS